MSKAKIHTPIVAESGRVFEKVWRIKHMPSGYFFKPGRGFATTEGRLAKTYSRKPGLGILCAEYDYKGNPGKVWHTGLGRDVPRSEIKVIEYIITESGTVYDK